MFSVARGAMSGGITFRPAASFLYSDIYFSASSFTVIPISFARFIILSSTSLKFCTNFTLYPRHTRYRRSTSNTQSGRALPMCIRLYTVGPQAYIFTVSPIGINSSLFLLMLLYIFITHHPFLFYFYISL